MAIDSVIERVQVENELVELCGAYDQMLAAAYADHHAGRTGYLHLWLGWSLVKGLATPKEDQAWRNAMTVRNALMQRAYRIVLDDIREHIEIMKPVIAAVKARIERCPPSDDTDVVELNPE